MPDPRDGLIRVYVCPEHGHHTRGPSTDHNEQIPRCPQVGCRRALDLREAILQPKADDPMVRRGDTVRMVHNYGREAVVSSVADDGTLMLCMLIAGRYQLRGPFNAEDVERVNA